MASDKMNIRILADGTIKTTTDAVSKANHDNAEQFLRSVATLAGGTTTRVRRTDLNPARHIHVHDHDHSHEH
jgi:hypothetical protein